MKLKQICLILLLICTGVSVLAQPAKKQITPKGNSVNNAASKLSKVLAEEKSDEAIAKEYETLAKKLFEEKEYSRSEDYLQKAKSIYSKLNDKEKVSDVNRELAKIQESRSNYKGAIASYETASKNTVDVTQQKLNENDASRLRKQSVPESQVKYIQANISLLEKKGTEKEKVDVYKQLAETNIQLNQKDSAIKNYKKALENAVGIDDETMKIKAEIANVYAADQQYDKAIDIKEKLISEAAKTGNTTAEINQLQSLSSAYFSAGKTEEGFSSLMQAYNTAVAKGKTIEAKKSLELLVDQYQKNQDNRKSIALYKDFLNKLESLIKTDSSLVDAKLFQVTEEKIFQMEKERALKDELINKKNTFNYVLIASIILMTFLLGLIIKTLYSIKNKNKKIALQSLRREMNPHFIFNSLNSVNQFIVQNNELEANKYLTSYSKLMRNIMENSGKDLIRLSTEIDLLKEYLDLEYFRFKDKFSYTMVIDKKLDTECIYVPNILIQPHLENAIWHGLRYKEEKGILQLSISLENTIITITIEDNGIGLKRSKEIKTINQKVHQSRGLTNINERIKLLNELYDWKIHLDIIEKEHPETGVIVKIKFPFINKIPDN